MYKSNSLTHKIDEETFSSTKIGICQGLLPKVSVRNIDLNDLQSVQFKKNSIMGSGVGLLQSNNIDGHFSLLVIYSVNLGNRIDILPRKGNIQTSVLKFGIEIRISNESKLPQTLNTTLVIPRWFHQKLIYF